MNSFYLRHWVCAEINKHTIQPLCARPWCVCSHTVTTAGRLVGWGGGGRGGLGSPRGATVWAWQSTGDCRRWPERMRCSSAGERARPRSPPSGRSALGGEDTTPRPSCAEQRTAEWHSVRHTWMSHCCFQTQLPRRLLNDSCCSLRLEWS